MNRAAGQLDFYPEHPSRRLQSRRAPILVDVAGSRDAGSPVNWQRQWLAIASVAFAATIIVGLALGASAG